MNVPGAKPWMQRCFPAIAPPRIPPAVDRDPPFLDHAFDRLLLIPLPTRVAVAHGAMEVQIQLLRVAIHVPLLRAAALSQHLDQFDVMRHLADRCDLVVPQTLTS